MGLDMVLGKVIRDVAGVVWWQNAYDIHKWFVNNVGGGKYAECECITVKREHIEELRDICKRVLEDYSLASELLPEYDGGHREKYGDNYFYNVRVALEKCEEILEKFNFEEDELGYYASW